MSEAPPAVFSPSPFPLDEQKSKQQQEESSYEAEPFEAYEEAKQEEEEEEAINEYANESYDEIKSEEEEDEGEGDAMFEEEEVESVPLDEPFQLAPRTPPATTAAPAQPVRSSLSSLPSLSSKPSSSSYLPSLGGLPSIHALSSSLTAAGRAHFGSMQQQAGRLFGSKGRGGASNSFPSFSAASPAPPAASVPTPTWTRAQAKEAYAASNRLCAAESLGIHALRVAPEGQEEEEEKQNGATALPSPTTAPATSLLLDNGKLKLWTGSSALGGGGGGLEGLVGNGSMPGFGAAAGSAAAGGAGGGAFLRARLMISEKAEEGELNDANYLHIFVDALDPMGSSSSSAEGHPSDQRFHSSPHSAAAALCADGSLESSVLPECFHVKRLGPYRLRIVSRATSMPSRPASFDAFVQNVREGTGGEGDASAGTTPFDMQPVVTLFVAVEKLVSPEEEEKEDQQAEGKKKVASTPTRSHVLPPLELNTPHTFWLSTHQQPLAAAPASSSSPSPSNSYGDLFSSSSSSSPLSSSSSTLLFAPSASDTSDHLELVLDAQPLHPGVMNHLIQIDPHQAAREAVKQIQARKEEQMSEKERKKKMRQKEKKRQIKKEKMARQGQLVQVSITAASTNSESDDLVVLQIVANPDAVFASSSSSSSSSSNNSAPSLVDLLATLAAAPSTSLPSSILPANDSLAHVAQLAANFANRDAPKPEAVEGQQQGATVAPGGPSVPLPAASPAVPSLSPPAPVPAVPSPSPSAVLLRTLDSCSSWPFRVSLSAMRLSDEIEAHREFDQLDLLHNRFLPLRKKGGKSASRHVVLCGDHEVELLRTVGLLCGWERPKDGSPLNEPVLVSQDPHLSFHVQMRITRLSVEEANQRRMDELLGEE